MNEQNKRDTNVRPNVLWIYGEDLGPQLSCYGEKTIETPNIDRLAREGVRFTNAFVTCPVCSPSRSALITGKYQTSINAHHHRSRRDQPLPDGVKLVTDYFRGEGYFTCNSSGPPFNKPGKTDFNFKREDPFDGVDWSERAAGQPFYAQCNLPVTHRMQRFSRGHADSPPDPAKVDVPAEYPDHELVRRDWSLYLESVAREDALVGEILKRLDDEGLAQNTIVVMMSDHGPGHPRHKQFCYDGGLHIPLLIRWPARLAAGIVSDELVSGIDLAPTSLALCGIEPPAEMQGRVFLGNKAVSPRDCIFAARDRCDGTLDRIRAVRTKTHKLIRNYFPERAYTQFCAYKESFYPTLHLMRDLKQQGQLKPEHERFLADARPEFELYDLTIDPHELRNLAGNDEVRDIEAQLKETLDNWVRETGDMGEHPEPAEAVEAAIADMNAAQAKWMTERSLPPHPETRAQLKWWDHWVANAGSWDPLGEWD